MSNFIVALDGPAGSGKSSISKLVAEKFGFTHIDTGAMYRAVTLEALRRKININNEEEYTFLNETKVIYSKDRVYLNGEDVTKEIRKPNVTNAVSTCCKFKTVREYLVNFQRESAEIGQVIMDGRDIGTVVLPNADLKIFLTASPEVRAKRRYDEIMANGGNVVYEVILEEIKLRDYKDSTREISPLKQAEDAVLIDTSYLTMDEVVEKISKLISERLENGKF